MTERNYEFVPEDTINVDGHILTRIRAIKDIPYHNVKAGDLGGYVETYENLTENAWVYGNARVFGRAHIFDDSLVAGNACVYGDAIVSGDARIYGNARVSGNAHVSDRARVSGHARVSGDAHVSDNAYVHDNARVSGHARVSDNTGVSGSARVHGHAWITDNAWVHGDAHVYGGARVFGNACVSGDATIKKTSDVIFIGPAKSSGRYTNAFKDSKIGVRVVTGCFSGSVDEFKAAIEETHKDDPEFLKQYRCFAAAIEASF